VRGKLLEMEIEMETGLPRLGEGQIAA